MRNLIHQTNDTAQLFLGTRINCAQCHHHPYEKWSQDDYYQFQAFFARMGRKSRRDRQRAGHLRQARRRRSAIRRRGKVMQPHGLDGPAMTISEDDDPRQKLVDWMAAPDNPFFARAIGNRLWAHFMGRGLVEPIDDMRVTNPPSNPELLDALAKDFVDHKFDLKHLIRTIMNSTAYQLSSEPTAGNVHDQQNYARAYPRRLPAEVMLDAICQVTGTPGELLGSAEGHAGDPTARRVGRLVLPRRLRPADARDRLRMRTAARGQPRPGAAPAELQRHAEQGRSPAGPAGRTAQGEEPATRRSSRSSTWPRWAGRRADRGPQAVLDYVAKQPDRKAGFEDVFWAILNTKEFLFNH